MPPAAPAQPDRPLSPLPHGREDAGPALAPLPAVRVSTARQRSKLRRTFVNKGFHALCILSAIVSIAVLVILLVSIGFEGKTYLDGVNSTGLAGETVAVPAGGYGYIDAPRDALSVDGGSYTFRRDGQPSVRYAAEQVAVSDDKQTYTATDDEGAQQTFTADELVRSDLEYTVDASKLEPSVEVWKINAGDAESEDIKYALATAVHKAKEPGRFTAEAYDTSGRNIRTSTVSFTEAQVVDKFQGVPARTSPSSSVVYGIPPGDRALKRLSIAEARDPVDLSWWGRMKRYTEFFGFLTSFPSRYASQAGLAASLWGSIFLCIVCAAAAIPLGVATAIALEEFKPRNYYVRRVHDFINLNVANLAGVPSIVYGILGLTVFVRMWGVFGSPNIASYDEMYALTLRDGAEIRAEMTDRYGLDNPGETVTYNSPLTGEHTVVADEAIRSYTVIHVSRHVFELTDGRSWASQHISWDNDAGTITLDHPELVGGDAPRPPAEAAPETLTFSRSDVAEMGGEDRLALGGPDDWYYVALPFGGSVLAGGLTLALVVLPIVIVSAREALRAVPKSLREAAFALGCTRWQMVRGTILPAAVPGIMTGSILAMSRAIGEAAPLLVIGGFLFIMFTPGNLMADFAAMPLQIFNWAGRPQDEFHQVAASGIIVLLAVLLTFNITAAVIRQKFQKPLQ